MEITIEKNIPFMGISRLSNDYFPFDKMEVGDSFIIPHINNTPNPNQRVRLFNIASRWVKKNASKNVFATRSLPEGVRIWRIK